MSARKLFPFWRFLAPGYWPTWLALGFMRAGSALPYSWQLKLGSALGRLVHRLAAGRRRVARINIDHCFPQHPSDRRDELVRATFEASVIGLFESGLGWWASEARLRALHRVEGLEHLEAALAPGKGVILLGGHYTTIEVSARLMGFHNPHVWPIYKRAHNALYDAFMAHCRSRMTEGILDNLDIRSILRTLKAGKIVWIAPDQDFGRERSVFAPFFGVATATLTSVSRLARMSGAPVLPFYSERLPGNEGFVIRIGKPLKNFPSDDDVADATLVNRTIEAQVLRTPEQYLWIHKRFKTRPPGEPDMYR